jgi:hypothetical protein
MRARVVGVLAAVLVSCADDDAQPRALVEAAPGTMTETSDVPATAPAAGPPTTTSPDAAPTMPLATTAFDAAPPTPCADDVGQPRHSRLGFSPGATLISADRAMVDRELDGMAAAGVCWVRIDIDWSRVQPEPDRFDWEPTDRAVEGARARGMEVLGLVAYSPPWARPDGTSDKHPPDDPAAFARFAELAAQRYGPAGVRAWEIWNEPNIDAFWEPGADAHAYASLLVAAAEAIRAVDRHATIVTGGLSPASDDDGNLAPATFLDALYDAGAEGSFDAVGMHPYSYPLNPVDAVPLNHFVTETPAVRAVMVANGDTDAQIWATEYGAPTGEADQAVSDREQAAFLAAAIEQWDRWDWAGPLMIYSWRDRGTSLDDREDNFGLLDHDFRPKPALDTLLAVTGGAAPR